MHLKGLDLNLLVVLDVLLAEKNITRTGQRINLSQSATSGALARLREYFGDPLLVQVGQHMELTPVAERLAGPIHEIILRCEATIDKNEGFRPETSTRTFHLNMSDSSAAVIMSRTWGRIKQAAPGVRIELSSVVDEPIVDYLERHFIDLIVTPHEMTSPLHPAEQLFIDQFVAVVWSGSPLAEGGITMDKYLSSGHIVARFSKVLGWALDEALIARAGYQRRIEMVTSSFSMQLYQLIGTNLVATAHERFARCYAQHLPIRIFPSPIPLPRLEIKLQWHRFLSNDLGIQWLRNMLRESAEQLEPLS
jgi:LysR family nod box-dependent transcriptional activator